MPRILVMVLAGGAGSRLGPLTDGRAKPAAPAAVFAALDAAVDELGEQAVEDGGLADLGDTLLPRLVADGTALAHPLGSYWRDVGTLDAYWSAHRDLLGDPPRLDLDDQGWPIRTHEAQRPPARLRPAAVVEDSLVSPACVVHGSVRGSVLGPGVVVEPGASVVDSVVLADTVVRSGAAVTRAILDERTEVGADARVGRAGAGITVTGRAVDVPAGTEYVTEEEQ